MRRRSDDTTSCLPPVLQEHQNKQRSGRRGNTDAHIPSPPVNFLLLLPNNPGAPLAVSLCCLLPVWPSCSCGSTLKVTLCTRRHCLSLPYHHQSHTHAHTGSSSVPGPVNNTPSTQSRHLQFAIAPLRWMEEVEFSQWGSAGCGKKMEICTDPTPSPLVKALLIKMLFDSTLINPQRPCLLAASRSQRGEKMALKKTAGKETLSSYDVTWNQQVRFEKHRKKDGSLVCVLSIFQKLIVSDCRLHCRLSLPHLHFNFFHSHK